MSVANYRLKSPKLRSGIGKIIRPEHRHGGAQSPPLRTCGAEAIRHGRPECRVIYSGNAGNLQVSSSRRQADRAFIPIRRFGRGLAGLPDGSGFRIPIRIAGGGSRSGRKDPAGNALDPGQRHSPGVQPPVEFHGPRFRHVLPGPPPPQALKKPYAGFRRISRSQGHTRAFTERFDPGLKLPPPPIMGRRNHSTHGP